MALLVMHERQGGGKKPEKFPRSTIGLDETTESQDFQVAWSQYKKEYGLQATNLTRQLYACCMT